MLTITQKRIAAANKRDEAISQARARYQAIQRERASILEQIAALQARLDQLDGKADSTHEGQILSEIEWLASGYYLDIVEEMARLTPDPKPVTAARRQLLKEAS